MSEISRSFHYNDKWLYFFIGLAIFVNFSGLFVPLMDPDAGVYASISKNMVLHNNYLELYLQGKDWLDKPHFPFWVIAAFFKVFGMHTWSYKLPSILFLLMAAYYTYRFARQFYRKDISLWAVFILLTAEHIIISNNDVRAEPFLTGLIMAAIFHFSRSITKKFSWHLVVASFFAACAVMTKGPFTLIPISGAIVGELIMKKNWKQLFHWKWLLAGLLVALFIIPEIFSLWYQFDKHPEKIVFGRTGVSGIRFFFWDSQFGRFFNTGPIKGKGNPFFFLHTLLWAFLPWSLIMYFSLFEKIRSGIKKTSIREQEWYSLFGSLLTLLIFSFSRFQLPYYSNIIFPLLSIITAQYIFSMRQPASRIFRIIHNGISIIFLTVGVLLQYFYTPTIISLFLILIIGGIFLLLITLPYWVSGRNPTEKTSVYLVALYRAGLASLVFNLYLNWVFYPDLLTYQSSKAAAFYINKNYPGVKVGCLNIYSPSFEFYIRDTLVVADTNSIKMPDKARATIWYVTQRELDFIKQSGLKYEIIKEFTEFHVTMLSMNFINTKTRNKELKKYYLVKMV